MIPTSCSDICCANIWYKLSMDKFNFQLAIVFNAGSYPNSEQRRYSTAGQNLSHCCHENSKIFTEAPSRVFTNFDNRRNTGWPRLYNSTARPLCLWDRFRRAISKCLTIRYWPSQHQRATESSSISRVDGSLMAHVTSRCAVCLTYYRRLSTGQWPISRHLNHQRTMD